MHLGKKPLFAAGCYRDPPRRSRGSLSTERRQGCDEGHQGGSRDRHRQPQRQGVQLAVADRPEARRAEAEVSRAASTSRRPPPTGPNLTAAAQAGYNLVFGVGFLLGDATARGGALPDDEVRDHRLLGRRGDRNAQAEERPRPALQGAGGGLPGRRTSRARAKNTATGRHDRDGRRTRSRRLTATSPATSTASSRSQPDVKSRTATRRTSSIRRSARRRRSTRSPTARGRLPGRRQCGLGALDAAKEKGVWGIGVDADQCYLGTTS